MSSTARLARFIRRTLIRTVVAALGAAALTGDTPQHFQSAAQGTAPAQAHPASGTSTGVIAR